MAITDRELVGVAGPEGEAEFIREVLDHRLGLGVRAPRRGHPENPRLSTLQRPAGRPRKWAIAPASCSSRTGRPAFRGPRSGLGHARRAVRRRRRRASSTSSTWVTFTTPAGNREYKKRFLPYWPVRENERDRVSSWCLNGNHDMYSGGFGYFDFLLADPRFARQQGSSYFSLRNDHWHILGLDTAYKDESLHGRQPEWVESELTSSGRAGLLLSHHQLFSAYDPVKPACVIELAACSTPGGFAPGFGPRTPLRPLRSARWGGICSLHRPRRRAGICPVGGRAGHSRLRVPRLVRRLVRALVAVRIRGGRLRR